MKARSILFAAAGGSALAFTVAATLSARDFRLVPDVFASSESAVAAGRLSDSAAVVATVDAYHRALAEGDSVAVARLLAEDVVILEEGRAETRAQYLGGHLRGDIAFARAVPRERSEIRVLVGGDVAWATSTSVSRGEYRERQINSAGAELMVLRRAARGWEIVAIHWSSRDLR